MERRRFLSGCLVPAAATVAGCRAISGSGTDCETEWPPDVEADEPTLSSGTSTTIGVDVSAATGLAIGRPSSDDVEFDVAGASVVPTPDRTADVSPPKWYWESCTGVAVTVPVRIPEDADGGDHEFTVAASHARGGEEETVEVAFTVGVSGTGDRRAGRR